jgi:hypothetical protein
MRTRKPWTLLRRRRLGWKVRLGIVVFLSEKCLLEGDCRSSYEGSGSFCWRPAGLTSTRVQGLKTPAPQQGFSIAELRKTSNKFYEWGCQGDHKSGTGRGRQGFFTRFGATRKFFLRLRNLSWRSGWVRVIVSSPFRDSRCHAVSEFLKAKTVLFYFSFTEWKENVKAKDFKSKPFPKRPPRQRLRR